LVPQREVLGYHLILVNAGRNLHRPEDKLLFGKLQYDDFSHFGTVATGRHQADQVVLVPRRERKHKQKLGLLAIGSIATM